MEKEFIEEKRKQFTNMCAERLLKKMERNELLEKIVNEIYRVEKLTGKKPFVILVDSATYKKINGDYILNVPIKVEEQINYPMFFANEHFYKEYFKEVIK